MPISENSIGFLSERLVPEFYVTEGSNLVPFIQAFVLWLNQKGRPLGIVSDLISIRDIDETIDQYLDYLKYEYARDMPAEIASDLRKFLKNVLWLYRSKGSVASFEYFFRTLYGASVEMSYPKEHILKASDGRWFNDYYIACGNFETLDFHTSEGNEKGTASRLFGMRIRAVDFGEGYEEDGKPVIKKVYGEGFIDDIQSHNFPSYGRTDAFRVSAPTGEFPKGKPVIIDFEFSESNDYYTSRVYAFNSGTGYWQGVYGQVSNPDILLQDSYYYQDFSYVLATSVPFETWNESVKKLLHPAGLKIFGNYQLYDVDDSIISYWGIKLWLMMTYRPVKGEDGKPLYDADGYHVYEDIWKQYETGEITDIGTAIGCLTLEFQGNVDMEGALETEESFTLYLQDLQRVCKTIEELYDTLEYNIPQDGNSIIEFAMQSNKDSLLVFDKQGNLVPEPEIDWIHTRFRVPRECVGTFHTADIGASNFVCHGKLSPLSILAPKVEEDITTSALPIVFYKDDFGKWRKVVQSTIEVNGSAWKLGRTLANKEVFIYQAGGLSDYQAGNLVDEDTILYVPQGKDARYMEKKHILLFVNGKMERDFSWVPGRITLPRKMTCSYEIYTVETEENISSFLCPDGITMNRSGWKALMDDVAAKILFERPFSEFILEDLYETGLFTIPNTDACTILDFGMQSNDCSLLIFDRYGEHVPEKFIDWHNNRFVKQRAASGTYFSMDIGAVNFAVHGYMPRNGIFFPYEPEDVSESKWLLFYYNGHVWSKLHDSRVTFEDGAWKATGVYAGREFYLYQAGGLSNYQTGTLKDATEIEYTPTVPSSKNNLALFVNGLFMGCWKWNEKVEFFKPVTGVYELYQVNSRENVSRFFCQDGLTLYRHGLIELNPEWTSKVGE